VNNKPAANLAAPANIQVPFGSESGTHYHFAIQFDQQGAHDLAANHYKAAAEYAGPGDFRDFCLSRLRAITIATCFGPSLTPSLN
jgi:hypothetical protein